MFKKLNSDAWLHPQTYKLFFGTAKVVLQARRINR
jgi:hypothetical protein